MACRSRSRSPVEASFTQSADGIYLEGEIDFEFPMLTDEDIDCIVQDISNAGGAPLGSIEKPSAIDAIHKHVEESLLFLDKEKSENKTESTDQKINLVVEKSGSDDTIMQDVDDSSNTREPQKNYTVILKQENINDVSIVDEQQKYKSEIESITTENKVDTLLEHVKQETSHIPEQMETNDVILSLKDNPISDSVLNEIDKYTPMNYPQEETSGISEQPVTVRVFSQEDNPGCVVNETDTDAVVNVSLEQKSETPLLKDSEKAITVSLEHNSISDGVLNEINKDAAMDNPQEVTSDITEQIDTSKVIVSQEDNPSSDTDAVVNVSREQESEITQLNDSKNAIIVSLKDNLTSDSVLIKVDKDADMDDPQEDVSGISEQIDPSKFNVSQKNNPSDFAILKIDTNAVVNVSLEQSEIPQLTDSKKANIESLEHNPTTDSVLNEINVDTMISENKPSELLGQSDGNKAFNALQDDNPSSLNMLNETDTEATIYDSELKSSDISEQSDASKFYNASQEDNPSSDNMLSKTDTDAEINNVTEVKTSDISIEHEGISRSNSLLDETDADVTMNSDSQEELGDNSKQMITDEISNVSPEQKSSSDSMLNKTDLDASMDDTQESISDITRQTDEMDGSKCEENGTSDDKEAETVAAISGPQEDTSDISEGIDFSEISNISQADNKLLNETDTDAAMKDSLDIPEQIEVQNVDNVYKYKVLNETNTDVTSNDSQEEASDISELIDNKEVSMVSQQNFPSDSVLNKTDKDESLNDSQEEINDTKIYIIDDSDISEKDNGPLDMELDKTDAVLHEGYETEDKTEGASNCQDNLKSIKKEDHENSVTEPQKGRILIESTEIKNQTDKPTQGIENTFRKDKEHDKLPKLESNVVKSGMPENETQVRKEMNEIKQTTQKSQEKELVWEIKSIKHEPEEQKKKELLQIERSQEQNVSENPIKKNPLVRAAPTEDVTECLPAKRPRFQPVWTTNPLNDEDKPKAEQVTCSSKSDNTAIEAANDTTAKAKEVPVNPYLISQEVKKQLQTWILKSGLAQQKTKFKYMFKLVNDSKWNKAVLRMAPIPKDYKPMDVFRVIRDQTEAYEKDITKNIQFIHIDKHDDIFNAAYIKWRDIDKLLVVKAYQILVTTSFTVDGVVKQPLFKYDDRSIIDWNENDRPIMKQKDGDMEIPKTVSTPALTPVVTPTATVAATTSATPLAKLVAAPAANPVAATVAKPAATPVPTPRPRKPPPPAFSNGEINVKDRQSYGLSNAFMDYHNIRPPIVCFVFVRNLDISHSVEIYHRIFSAAGDIVEIEVLPAPRHEEQLSLKLRITFNHALEAVQAVSMFHEQILFNRVIEVEIGNITLRRKTFKIEGLSAFGPGLGLNGFIMKNIRSNFELSKLRAKTKVQLDNFKVQISSLRQKLAAAVFKMEQFKRDEEKRRCKEEKKQLISQNETQNKQASMDAVSAITTAIASSVQANVMGMLGIQANKQDQNVKQNTPSVPVNNQPVGVPQSQNTSRAPVNWTANENTSTTLPNQNMPGQTSMDNSFQNLGREFHGYQNQLDPYSYYANMQQVYAQYGYTMDPSLMQAYVQSGVSYMQPGIANVQPVPAVANVQPVPAIETSNIPPTTPKTQSMPKIISNQFVPSKPSNPTQSKVHTQSKTILPPLPITNKNVTVYEVQKPRFDVPPANVGNKITSTSRFDVPPANVRQTTAVESKVPEIPLPIPTISQPAVKTAFKVQKPIVPPKVTKPVSINMKIPSVLPETVPLVVQNPRTLEKNSVQRKLMKLAGKMPAEPWINKQIRDMRKNSKSPERIRKSPEKIKSPDRTQMFLPKAIQPSRTVRRMSRSPERRGISRSPVRRNSRSPIRRRSRSTEKRRVSRSPKKRMSRSPVRRRSRSPIRRRSRSTERRRISRSPVRRNSRSPIRRRSRSTERRRMSRSPKRRMSRSPKRRISRSPKRGLSRSPVRRKSKSPIRRRSRSPKRGISRSPKRAISRSPKRRISRSPKRRISRSPKRRISKSPIRRKSRSPVRRISKSPLRKISRSPVRQISRSPVRRISRSPVRRISKSPVRLSMPPSEIGIGGSRSLSSELGPKATPRPAYEPDGASRDKSNLDHGDRTANYNYILEMERELANTSVNFSFLPPSVTTADLTDKMSEIGELLEVRAFGMGKAMVVFKLRHDAATCIEMYNMAKVDGQTIEVRWASIE